MNQEKYDLMEQFVRLQSLLHRFQVYNLRNHGPFSNPHRGQGRVLAILKMQPEISQKDLGYLLDMRTQSLGELLGKLEKGGYITRTPSDDDKRMTIVKLTDEGLAAANEASGEEDNRLQFKSLNDDEKEKLGEYLERIIGEIETLLKDAGVDAGMPPFRGRAQFLGEYIRRIRDIGPMDDGRAIRREGGGMSGGKGYGHHGESRSARPERQEGSGPRDEYPNRGRRGR